MRRAAVIVVVASLLSACAPEEEEARPPAAPPMPPPGGPVYAAPPIAPAPPPPAAAPWQTGLATWYGAALAGHRTASGEPFNPADMTAAHRTLPLGTWVVVRLVATGRVVRVRINDRGPFGDAKRVIDVSRAAADALGLTRLGVSAVEIWVEAPR
jgi:rare lipoprotein A